MIPIAHVQEWAVSSPWPDLRQVEQDLIISRALCDMLGKLTRSLAEDITPMLAADMVYGDAEALDAFERIWFRLIAGLNGEPWHKSSAVIDELRTTSLPDLLRRAQRPDVGG